MKGHPIHNGKSLNKGDSYLEGNSFVLTDYFKHVLGKDDIKIAFFGDNYISDCYESAVNDGWDAIAIVEEMTLYDIDYCEGKDPELLNFQKLWTNDYFLHKTSENVFKKNYFVAKMEECCRYALPLIKNMKLFMQADHHKSVHELNTHSILGGPKECVCTGVRFCNLCKDKRQASEGLYSIENQFPQSTVQY